VAAADLRRFREGPGAAAEAAHRATVSARAAGEANERDLLRAEEKWLDARRTELELLDDYITARCKLLAALGE
jgi:outer membrane protein TolC